MIELAMLFALGWLAASLVALIALPIVTRRAFRAALANVERRMPLSMAEIAADRDQRRAVHAVEVRRVEQRAEALNARLAASMAASGRQVARLLVLEDRTTADAATIAELAQSLTDARRTAAEAEATVGAQLIALRDVEAHADRRNTQLAEATARIAAAEILAADQRTMLAELETQLTGDLPPPGRSRTERVPEKLTDDSVQLRATLGRLRTDQELLRTGLAAASGERDRLRLRVDELLLRIEDLQEKLEEAGDEALSDRRQAVRHAKAVEQLTARLAKRDEALADAKVKLRAAGRRGSTKIMGAGVADPAAIDHDALRRSIAALAADLIRAASADQVEIDAEEAKQQYRLALD